MSETPNHGYNVPDEGETNWHEPLNENFEDFEVDIEIRDAGDPDANGYAPANGAKYLDTANGIVYLVGNDGWEEAFSFGGGGGESNWQEAGAFLEPTDPGIEGIDLAGDEDGAGTAVASQVEAPADLTLDRADSRGLTLGEPETVEVDGTELTGGGTVVFGQLNTVEDDILSAVIGGGGIVGDDGEEVVTAGNLVAGHYGTVAGGVGNVAGDPEVDGLFEDSGATVGGGQDNEASGNHSTVAGGDGNEASGSSATVGGGSGNVAAASSVTIAGGNNNVANELSSAAIGGGQSNEALGGNSAIAGGLQNVVDAIALAGAIGGGYNNTVSENCGAVAGGEENTASGEHATVPGGYSNEADGNYSLAAGREATAAAAGSFVWGDSSEEAVQSLGSDQFVVQAGGGVTIYSDSDTDQNIGVELPSGDGSWSSLSASTAKSGVSPVRPDAVLDGVESLDISMWHYNDNEGVEHMGPMAEQFHEQFGLGGDERRISNVDADGVALAAIQGLAERLDDAREGVVERDDRIEELETEVERKDDRIEELDAKNERLEARLRAVEAELGLDAADD
jgi:hypothetical protein